MTIAPPLTAPPPASPALDVSPLRGSTEKLSRLRKIIARRMSESLQNTAQLTTVVEIDVTKLAALRDEHKQAFVEREGVKLSFLPFFAKAAVEGLQVYPRVNSTLDLEAGTVTYPDAENLGIAVDTAQGLYVPVIADAGNRSVAEIARRVDELADRVRSGTAGPDDLAGGTFTLTNTGSRGALFDTPILNRPQSAILGTGAVVRRPMVARDASGDEVIAIRSMVYFALTYDHRIVDGADAARYLTWVKQRLEGAQFDI
ncbi:pyruvate/2-oxoglutarate dehydrogenase complex dihydrolipoamide acyltransferase (E2) component [Microbacterium terrae]|uniref:Dihydrolipoyllysine-residue acetyltransferase component of pyruvate dehydrogenase complex n=1 Tax=Microbacterium terrae TaxID=69369 RepID=A0A0M2HBL8_9MICO|nr:2-oxo acid dehydrogenase subunit E2 [Microbacterium terrae]KJL44006.1 Dihydrolipoyllysine-residue acetyltransferase component of pyruvate dehydrogenase complex [Microbacterium terrae]MBP1079460.1 pyruvate/2-oxoglutarate dehydrogenase complex dihydrolipoamide acyltransferase (E2) component [Microbacterium terrae]GLJ98861.1 hypothetical protein GCM10017594_20580 [Microbacterium terrae]